jgi:hypothetical protein
VGASAATGLHNHEARAVERRMRSECNFLSAAHRVHSYGASFFLIGSIADVRGLAELCDGRESVLQDAGRPERLREYSPPRTDVTATTSAGNRSLYYIPISNLLHFCYFSTMATLCPSCLSNNNGTHSSVSMLLSTYQSVGRVNQNMQLVFVQYNRLRSNASLQ